MNKISMPAYDDAAAFVALADNPAVASHPELLPLIAKIHAGYQQYIAVGGNVFNIMPVPLAPKIAEFLRGHYRSPNKDLAYITSMREETEHKPCPMCGSFHSGTLDHLLPKNSYAAFAVFSKNLVPACKCNIKRKETLKGLLPSQRILHPYFDGCLAERLIGAEFSALGAVPLVTLKLHVPTAHPDFAAISFHVKEIVERSGIKKWLISRWAMLCRKPSLVVRELKVNPGSPAQLRDILFKERDILDEGHESKNNWESVFISGLLEAPAINWIFIKMSVPGRLPDGALL